MTAVVTGGSSGIGLCVCRELSAAGCTVYELSRRETGGDAAVHMSCDVTDEAAVRDCMKRINDEAAGVDILVCCAGFGISGACEFTEAADARRQMDVNLIGTANAVSAAVPYMRAKGGGRIVCLSSVAAVAPIPFQAWYSASKAAINAYAMALANELRPFGISVCAVMPGDTRTGFTAARKKLPEGDDVYSGRISRSVSRMESDEQGGVPAAVVGRFVAKKALQKRVKPLYAVGFSYKLIAVVATLLPCGLKNRVIGLLYAK